MGFELNISALLFKSSTAFAPIPPVFPRMGLTTAAVVGEPPLTDTAAYLYPEPKLSESKLPELSSEGITLTTSPPDIVAVADAELPLPVIVIVGAELYPAPGLSTAYPTI